MQILVYLKTLFSCTGCVDLNVRIIFHVSSEVFFIGVCPLGMGTFPNFVTVISGVIFEMVTCCL
jgi:hypothetical protein